ncbi:MAG: hypothetical protein ABJA79_11520 [Parafilimonas sp.]
MSNDRLLWRQFLKPIIILFIVISSACLFLKKWLHEKNIDAEVVMAANALFFILAIVNGIMRIRALKNPNPNVYIRASAAIAFIKLMVSAIAVAIYLFTAGESKSVYAVIVGMVLYLFYMIVETNGAIKMTKRKNGSS